MTLPGVALLAAALTLSSAPNQAQPNVPVVSIAITLPDGSTQTVAVHESEVSTFKAKDGTAYEIRPTVHDLLFASATVAIFNAPTTTDAGSLIAELEVKKGLAAVATKSTPSFKVAIKSIELSAKK